MVYVFVVFVIMEWIFSFLAAFSFEFRTEYKKYHSRLFERGNMFRPSKWGISRQRNKKRYEAFKWATILMLLFSLAYGCILDDALLLFALTIIVPLVITIPLGMFFGKRSCAVSVRKECKKFNIQCIEV